MDIVEEKHTPVYIKSLYKVSQPTIHLYSDKKTKPRGENKLLESSYKLFAKLFKERLPD